VWWKFCKTTELALFFLGRRLVVIFILEIFFEIWGSLSLAWIFTISALGALFEGKRLTLS
jgi:hypothetical protein